MKAAPSYCILLTINLLTLIFAIVILGITLDIVYGPGLNVASLDGLPVQIYYVVIAFALFVFMISLLGVIGGTLHSKFSMIIYTILDLALALVLLIVMIFVLLYANGKSTTTTIDNSIGNLQAALERELLTQAINEPVIWLDTQKGFGCCGIDFNQTYQYAVFAKTDANFSLELQPTDACATGRAEIAVLHAEYPTYNSSAQAAADENSVLSTYFCKTAVSAIVRRNTVVIGAIAGVIVFLQIITAAAAIRLLSKITVDQGGFVVPKDETGQNLAFGAPDDGGPKVNQVSEGNTLA